MTDISYNDHVLIIGDTRIEMPAKVLEATEVRGNVVAVVESEGTDGSIDEQNVFCYSADGEQHWRIETPERKSSFGEPSYQSVSVEDGDLYAYNWNSYEYKVDMENGSITEIRKADK